MPKTESRPVVLIGGNAYRLNGAGLQTAPVNANGSFSNSEEEWTGDIDVQFWDQQCEQAVRALVALSGEQQAQVHAALEVARNHGNTDGAHHKAWVIDQMVRALTGPDYAAWVAAAKFGNDGPNTFGWDEGMAP